MSNFKNREIREIAQFNPNEKMATNTVAKKIPMGCLREYERKITGYEISEYKSGAKFRNGDVLLAKITPCLENGKTALVDILDKDEVAFGSTEFIVLRAKNNSDQEYLYYLARSPAFRKKAISCMEGTSGRKRVNEGALKLQELPIPDKHAQQKIAAVLSALDAKIDCNKRINAELEAMAKTLYDYWFVQFDFPDANGKPYKTSGGKMVYNATLKREVPAGWKDAVVADILDKTPSSTKILNQAICDTGSIPVIDQSQSYICGFTDEDSSLIVPSQPHVVFGDHTRAVKLVNFSYARGADGTQILVSKDTRMPGYLLHQVVSDIDLSSYGYARHYKFLKESKIILPHQVTAQKYQATVSPWFETTRKSIFENFELARVRDWLLPLLMNGQVMVE